MHVNIQWQWFCEPATKHLGIQLESGTAHLCPYKASRLIPLYPLQASLTTDEAQLFQEFTECLEEVSSLIETSIQQPCNSDWVQAAGLNLLIIQRFGRPQLPQSWYFQEALIAEQTQQELKLGALVQLNSGLQQGLCVVLQQDGEFAECMVLGAEFVLSDVKTLRQFDVFKVMINRLQRGPHETHADGSHTLRLA